MSAKMVTKSYRKTLTRQDWELIKITLMKWCLRVKLLANWESFSKVLLETENMPIVEKSTKGDDFWGTVVVKEIEADGKKKKKAPKYQPSEKMPVGFLVGYNVLGRIEMELRENIKTGIDKFSYNFTKLEPIPIHNFLLFGQPIREILRK